METTLQKEIISRFINFFGEEFVDVQEDTYRLNVIIYFPELTVTNEYNKSIDIKDTFVKFNLFEDGSITRNIYIRRTYFTCKQWLCKYVHSHCPRFSSLTGWGEFCLGSGPIRGTITKIADNIMSQNIDFDLYTLFATELKLLLQVESLSGGPYINLESVNNYQNAQCIVPNIYYIKVKNELLDDFIKYLCKERSLEFTFNGYYYDFAYNDDDLRIILANKFIRYYNTLQDKPCTTEDLYTASGVLLKCTKRDGRLYINNNAIVEIPNEPVNTDLIFKGKVVPLIIEKPDNKDNNTGITILNSKAYSYVKTTILEKLNYGTASENYDRTPMLTILNH